ncbi:hypothetical protein OG2516_06082 [Oceanicola granulosus HTCC2516]|uniref:Uncharacterized protein n=1 Tax=Oceanicola granulosus (strain ATCC BAA-861 / DSM 15982 / KCTC 12143 / HTCC2516) TaxID=314256 RepID=Q2CDE8_OCEGH|nr:DUF4169 family protein [Oceanicola granulosus]EAR50642.1 hypothetical protein OG2516_06082 [Oceanicola granulosus HTCC2516]
MSKVVNLRQARKLQDRATRKKLADENALRHGRSKAQRLLEAAESQKMKLRLDAQKFDEG